MRRLIILPIILGLMLSMAPAITLAQVATPDHEETSTVGPASETPVESEQPADDSSDTQASPKSIRASNLQTPQDIEAPILTLNGSSESISLAVNDQVTIVTDSGAGIWVFEGTDCDGDSYRAGNPPLGTISHSDSSSSYRAFWGMTAVEPGSDCLTVTWGNPAPAVAPNLTLDGEARNKNLLIGQSVEISTESYAELFVYPGTTTCEGIGTPLNDSHSNDASNVVTSRSYRSAWTNRPNAPASDCLSVTWAPLPEITLNGTADNVTGDVGTEIIFKAENDAYLVIFQSEDCTGESETFGAGHTATHILPTTVSVHAVSNVDGTFASDCFTATWMKTTTVRIQMWDDSNLEGAHWSLYAPVASQVADGAYLTGELNDLNTASFTDLPAGEYLFVVQPDGQATLEFSITVSNESEDLVLQVAQPEEEPVTPEPTTVPATPEPTEIPLTPAPATPEATQAPGDTTPTVAAVTGLPSTGSGSGSGAFVFGIAGLIAALALVLIGSRRRLS